MPTHRVLAYAVVMTIATGCGGDKGDSKVCKELRAEVEAQETVQNETKVALKAAVAQALSTPPAASSAPCKAEGLSWQKFTHLTPDIVERGHLGDAVYLGDLKPGANCGNVNPENTKNKLASLRAKIGAGGNRLFFVDMSRVGAKLLPDNKFEPGNVKGRLLVWSDTDNKFICTGESYAESGTSLHTIKGGVKSSKDLDDHLTRNAVRSGIENLQTIDQ